MQCKYLHRSNEHLSSTRSDVNLKLPLQNICNFVAKKQKERKNERRSKREKYEYLLHICGSPFAPLLHGGSCRRPPSFALDKKLKHFPVSPYVSSHLAPPTHRLPSRQALVKHRALFMCLIPWKTSPFHPSLYTHTTYTHIQTHSHVFSLRAMAFVWQLLPLPSQL